tara:strand:+ start:94 stop:399 length:306 start_codon:yes stop_codon:yes gene_type:complete
MNVNKILKNKMLCYVAYVLALINIVGYINLGSFECLAVFGVAFYVLRHFTKNVTLQIFGGLLVSNVVFGCGRVREGMKKGGPVDDILTTLNAKNKDDKKNN